MQVCYILISWSLTMSTGEWEYYSRCVPINHQFNNLITFMMKNSKMNHFFILTRKKNNYNIWEMSSIWKFDFLRMAIVFCRLFSNVRVLNSHQFSTSCSIDPLITRSYNLWILPSLNFLGLAELKQLCINQILKPEFKLTYSFLLCNTVQFSLSLIEIGIFLLSFTNKHRLLILIQEISSCDKRAIPQYSDLYSLE